MGVLCGRAALVATVIALAGAGVGVVAAGPANAAATCSGTQLHAKSGVVGSAETPHTDSCQLDKGDRGEAVEALQKTLNQCYDVGTLVVDGIFGDKTREALIDAQRKAGTGADGIYGPKTRAALKWPFYNRATWVFNGCHQL